MANAAGGVPDEQAQLTIRAALPTRFECGRRASRRAVKQPRPCHHGTRARGNAPTRGTRTSERGGEEECSRRTATGRGVDCAKASCATTAFLQRLMDISVYMPTVSANGEVPHPRWNEHPPIAGLTVCKSTNASRSPRDPLITSTTARSRRSRTM
eukprot:scaffold181863_cov31-Tisochrysis_lutea.AAC.4